MLCASACTAALCAWLPPCSSPAPPRACLPACLCLQDKLGLRILGQILYVMQSSQPSGKQRIAIALSQLTTKEQPSGAQLRLMFLEKKGLDILLEMVQVRLAACCLARCAARPRINDHCACCACLPPPPPPPPPPQPPTPPPPPPPPQPKQTQTAGPSKSSCDKI